MSWLNCGVFVGHLRAQAVALFSRHEKQADVDPLLAQAFGGSDLGGNDSFRVAGTAAVDSRGIFGGEDEGRNRVQVGGEDHFRVRLLKRRGIDIKAIALDWNSSCLIADAGEFTIEVVPDGSFVAGDGFDVDELASEPDCVHGESYLTSPLQRGFWTGPAAA